MKHKSSDKFRPALKKLSKASLFDITQKSQGKFWLNPKKLSIALPTFMGAQKLRNLGQLQKNLQYGTLNDIDS